MDCPNSDETQHGRVARIPRGPSTYYAHARRQARDHACRFLAARLDQRGFNPAR